MADAELIRHQRDWKEFTNFVKIGTAGVLAVMALLFIFVF
jgi:hypothetical protein